MSFLYVTLDNLFLRYCKQGTLLQPECCHRLKKDSVLENNKMCEENRESQVVKVNNEFSRKELDGKRQLVGMEVVTKRNAK